MSGKCDVSRAPAVWWAWRVRLPFLVRWAWFPSVLVVLTCFIYGLRCALCFSPCLHCFSVYSSVSPQLSLCSLLIHVFAPVFSVCSLACLPSLLCFPVCSACSPVVSACFPMLRVLPCILCFIPRVLCVLPRVQCATPRRHRFILCLRNARCGVCATASNLSDYTERELPGLTHRPGTVAQLPKLHRFVRNAELDAGMLQQRN